MTKNDRHTGLMTGRAVFIVQESCCISVDLIGVTAELFFYIIIGEPTSKLNQHDGSLTIRLVDNTIPFMSVGGFIFNLNPKSIFN
jgi:hypothetical protein